jgi:hypothetical protein
MVVKRRITQAIVAGIIAGSVALIAMATLGINAAASSTGAHQATVAGARMDDSPNTLPIDY